jgi:WhiB family redox-sensing transcriptional regulator
MADISRDWHHHAACLGLDPEFMFPGRGDTQGLHDAIAVCTGCPVRTECLDDALSHGVSWARGVRGGTSERERRRIREARSRGRSRGCGAA